MKNILILFFLLLVGCALPTSEQALISKERIQHVCHVEPLEETLSKLVPKLSSCYNRSSTVPVYTGNTYTPQITLSQQLIEKRTDDDSRVFIVVGDSKYYGLRVAFEKGETEACPTKITMHTMNFAWERHASRVKKWLSEPEAGCQNL